MAAGKQRYDLLDGLRGVAALGVLFYHFGSRLGAPAAVEHGYLAVDFFFILSGFVIANAYSARLERLPWRAFLIIRAKRFLPLSILGLTIGTAYLLVRLAIRPDLSDSLPQLLGASALNLALIPKLWLARASTDELFPADGALWSLSMEMAVNLIWAALFLRARTTTMLLVAVAGALLLGLYTFGMGRADIGWGWGTYLGGVGKAVFGFFIGVVLWRFRRRTPYGWGAPWIAAALLMAILLTPKQPWWFDLTMILLVFPAIIHFAATPRAVPAGRLFRTLGELSFPLYALHQPFLMALSGLLKTLRPGVHLGYAIYLMAIPMILAAMLAARFYDKPLQRWLAESSGPDGSSRRGVNPTG